MEASQCQNIECMKQICILLTKSIELCEQVHDKLTRKKCKALAFYFLGILFVHYESNKILL